MVNLLMYPVIERFHLLGQQSINAQFIARRVRIVPQSARCFCLL